MFPKRAKIAPMRPTITGSRQNGFFSSASRSSSSRCFSLNSRSLFQTSRSNLSLSSSSDIRAFHFHTGLVTRPHRQDFHDSPLAVGLCRMGESLNFLPVICSAPVFKCSSQNQKTLLPHGKVLLVGFPQTVPSPILYPQLPVAVIVPSLLTVGLVS